jgi:hypothetical protein
MKSEPSLDDLLEDPIVQLVMQSDGFDEVAVRQIICDAARRLNNSPADDVAA